STRSMPPHPATPALLPYTTLFRSRGDAADPVPEVGVAQCRAAADVPNGVGGGEGSLDRPQGLGVALGERRAEPSGYDGVEEAFQAVLAHRVDAVPPLVGVSDPRRRAGRH